MKRYHNLILLYSCLSLSASGFSPGGAKRRILPKRRNALLVDNTTTANSSPFSLHNISNNWQCIASRRFGRRKYATRLKESSDQSNDRNDGDVDNLLPYSVPIRDYLTDPVTDVAFSGLVLLSSLIVGIETLDLNQFWTDFIVMSDLTISSVFTVEFFARWYSQGQMGFKHLLKPLAFIDVFVVLIPFLLRMEPTLALLLPAWLSSPGGLINLRLLRILRIQRVLSDMDKFSKLEMKLGLKASDVRPYQLQLARVVVSVLTLFTVSTGLIYTAEHTMNPDIPDYFTAMYFGLTTLTTVGFGDITPVTFQGRLVVMGSILVGVAIIPAQAAALVEALLEWQKERDTKRKLEEMGETIDDDSSVKYISSSDNEIGGSRNRSRRIRRACPACGTSPHRLDAFFCWSCGEELPIPNKPSPPSPFIVDTQGRTSTTSKNLTNE